MTVIQIMWLIILIVFIVAEAATAALVSLWFCAGSLVALLLSFIFPDMVWLQILSFIVVSAIAVAALRPMARKYVDNRKVPTNADASIGKVCQVVSEIQPALTGRVKLEGLEWSAVSNVVLPVGSWCHVLAIEGVKLVVAPLEQPVYTAAPPVT